MRKNFGSWLIGGGWLLVALLPAFGQQSPDDVELPTKEVETGVGEKGVGSGGTADLIPNVVATPPKVIRPSVKPSEGIPRWRYMPRAARSSRGGVGAIESRLQKMDEFAVPVGLIRGIVLVPGVKLADPNGAGTRAFVEALPLPRGFRGIRDYGTAAPVEGLGELERYLGVPADEENLAKLLEAVVFVYGKGGRKVSGIHIPEIAVSDGVVRMVVVGQPLL